MSTPNRPERGKENVMRRLTDHLCGCVNEQIEAVAMDGPGPGGASHHYQITPGGREPHHLFFQNGPIAEVGVNGNTNEALLAVLIDRMRGFQGGQYACRENAIALTKLEEALMWLQKRTRDRMARGVEGTMTK